MTEESGKSSSGEAESGAPGAYESGIDQRQGPVADQRGWPASGRPASSPTPAALGANEGTSDALVGLAKLAGGPLANDPARRARLASGGYLWTALATGALGFAMTVWQAAGLRALAWASRGLRSRAPDALLASLVPRSAFGVGTRR